MFGKAGEDDQGERHEAPGLEDSSVLRRVHFFHFPIHAPERIRNDEAEQIAKLEEEVEAPAASSRAC